MKISHFQIEGKDCCLATIDFFDRTFDANYRSDLNSGAIFYRESFSFANSSDLMIVVTVQQLDSSYDRCAVEIVAGGGGQGLFSFKWGNESRRLNKASNQLYEFCERNAFGITERQ